MPFIVPIIDGVLAFLKTKAGVVIIAFGVGYFMAWVRTNEHWKAAIAIEKAQQRAAYWAEIEREKAAARQIAEDAVKRAESDADTIDDMKRELDEYAKKEAQNVKVKAPNTCVVDRAFIGQLQQFSTASGRKANASRRAR